MSKRGFSRRFYCETPLKGSRDYGWDNAVGYVAPDSWAAGPYEGKEILRTYDIYVNLYNYSVYRMLDIACKKEGISSDYAEKAKNLALKMKPFFKGDQLPAYGLLVAEDGTEFEAGPFGMDETDYHWALTCTPFYPEYVDIYSIRNLLFEDLVERKDDFFLASYFSVIAAMDISLTSTDKLQGAVEYASIESMKSSKSLPMKWAMVEMSGVQHEGGAHYVRPQLFTMGAWIGAMSNLGLHRLPFGLSIQPAGMIKGIADYQYKGNIFNIRYEGTGKEVQAITVNGKEFTNTLQIPENLISESADIVVKLGDSSAQKNRLKFSNVALLEVGADLKVEAFGNSFLAFENLDKEVLVSANGKTIATRKIKKSGLDYIYFDAYGSVNVVLQ